MAPIDGGESDESVLAPVIPLFGGAQASGRVEPRVARPSSQEAEQPRERADLPWHASWVKPDPTPRPPRDGRAWEDGPSDDRGASAEPDEVRAAGEVALLRKLRTSQLSVSESRDVLIAMGMAVGVAEGLLDQFERLGYLDDVSLSQQLVRAGVERKGQGWRAISLLLKRRGIPRDVIDSVLSELPDDDFERALEFARTKGRSLGARDRETALRRLLGQLARRGYPSSISMAAARQALDEL